MLARKTMSRERSRGGFGTTTLVSEVYSSWQTQSSMRGCKLVEVSWLPSDRVKSSCLGKNRWFDRLRAT